MKLLYLIPFISAFVGWLAIRIAIKWLFHPRAPKKILGIPFQGFFPKRQPQLAEKLGKLISSELLSFSDIEKKIINPENTAKLMPYVEGHIDQFLRVKLAEQMPVISMFIGDSTIQQLKLVFVAELERLFPLVMQNYIGNLKQDLELEKIISSELALFSSDKLENILHTIMSKEFRFLEIFGVILGFLIGLIQVVLILIC